MAKPNIESAVGTETIFLERAPEDVDNLPSKIAATLWFNGSAVIWISVKDGYYLPLTSDQLDQLIAVREGMRQFLERASKVPFA